MNIAGQRFGRLLALHQTLSGKHARWMCRCDCGTEKDFAVGNMKTGRTTSCGCFRKENTARMKTTHGHSVNRTLSRTYKSWSHMMMRCYNKKQRDYRWYGAQGVKVCEAWHKFDGFLSDMGECPSDLTLDRINPFGNYEKENCRWATWETQYRNKRHNYEAVAA